MSKTHIKVSESAGMRFFSQNHTTPMVMLNLLRFKEWADYSESPHLMPEKQISGKEAYQLYMDNVHPMLSKIGSEVIFSGSTDYFLIGPDSEQWDAVLLVKHLVMKDFMAFASDPEYLKIAGHRTAALKDSRLLPIKEGKLF